MTRSESQQKAGDFVDAAIAEEIKELLRKSDDRRVARYCPNLECLCTESRVVDSRPVYSGAIRRTRMCPKCGARWSTLEQTIHVIWTPGPVTWESGGDEDGSKTGQG